MATGNDRGTPNGHTRSDVGTTILLKYRRGRFRLQHTLDKEATSPLLLVTSSIHCSKKYDFEMNHGIGLDSNNTSSTTYLGTSYIGTAARQYRIVGK